MEIILGYYLLFAVTTSLVTLYEIVLPVMRDLVVEKPEDLMVEHKYLSYFVFFFMGIILAPLLLIPCLVPSAGNRMRASLLIAIKG